MARRYPTLTLTQTISLSLTALLLAPCGAFPLAPRRRSAAAALRASVLEGPLDAGDKDKSPAAPQPKRQAKRVRLPDLSQKDFPPVPPDDEPYDLVVIGSGPGGEAAATRAAQLGARVAVVERKRAFGGPTGLTSKAVREAAERVVRAAEQLGGDKRKQMRRLWALNFPSFKSEAEVFQALETRRRYLSAGVDLFIGGTQILPNDECGQFKVRVCRPTHCVELPAKRICIATGSRAANPETVGEQRVRVPWEAKGVTDSSGMSNISELPRAVAIIGSGVIALEYATVLARLGVGVSLLCAEDGFLPFLAGDLRRRLRRRLQRDRVQVFDTTARPISLVEERSDGRVHVVLDGAHEGQKKLALRIDLLLYSGGRDANSGEMGLAAAGVEIGKYGRVVVDQLLRTTCDGIYAIGDVIQPPTKDFPAGLASAAVQHGRLVADQLFCPGYNKELASAPTTLWTLPEISTVGLTPEAAEATYPGRVVCGTAFYRDAARGRLSGDGDEGFVRLVAVWQPGAGVRRGEHVLVGAGILGAGANELIQLGSLQVNLGLSLEQLSCTPFAAVTLSGLYQVAAEEALKGSPFGGGAGAAGARQ